MIDRDHLGLNPARFDSSAVRPQDQTPPNRIDLSPGELGLYPPGEAPPRAAGEAMDRYMGEAPATR